MYNCVGISVGFVSFLAQFEMNGDDDVDSDSSIPTLYEQFHTMIWTKYELCTHKKKRIISFALFVRISASIDSNGRRLVFFLLLLLWNGIFCSFSHSDFILTPCEKCNNIKIEIKLREKKCVCEREALLRFNKQYNRMVGNNGQWWSTDGQARSDMKFLLYTNISSNHKKVHFNLNDSDSTVAVICPCPSTLTWCTPRITMGWKWK